MGNGPKENSQAVTSGANLNVAVTTTTTQTNCSDVPTGEDDVEEEYVPLLYTAVSESCGEIGVTHAPHCNDKNCMTKDVEAVELQGQQEEEGIDLLYNSYATQKAETWTPPVFSIEVSSTCTGTTHECRRLRAY